MQIWAESGKSALPICNYSQILYQFLTFTQNLKRSQRNLLLDSINTITIAKIKQAVFAMALTLKKGIFELLIDKSSNLVMPKTMPL